MMTAPGTGPGMITRHQLRPQVVADSVRSVPGPDYAYVVRRSPADASPMIVYQAANGLLSTW
jgi:hypothetical protein